MEASQESIKCLLALVNLLGSNVDGAFYRYKGPLALGQYRDFKEKQLPTTSL